jgi:hypothetical protein
MQVDAQQLSLQRIAFLPLVADESIAEAAGTFEARLHSDLRLPAGKALLDEDQLEGLLGNRSPRTILSRPSEMERFATIAGVAYLVGGVLTASNEGGYEFSLLIYDADTRQIAHVSSYHYPDDAALFSGVADVQAVLGRSRTYASADSAFFFSILVPGLGQLHKDKPIHALVSAGMVGLSILYAASTPDPDPFEFSREGFESAWNQLTGEFDYTIEGNPVSAEIFYQTLDENWEHHLTAQAERRAVKVRRKRAAALLVASYFFNVVDALVLAKEKTDTSPFFLSLEGLPASPGSARPGGMALRLRISFR